MRFPHWPPILDYLLHPKARQRNDASAAAEHNWRHHPAGAVLPAGMTLRWLGTAGFALRYGSTTVLIDPYFCRPSLSTVARRRALLGDAELVARYVDQADAVLVGHTHFDHAVDVPLIARRHQCRVYGSRSLATLMRLHNMAGLAIEPQPHKTFAVGPFEITFIPSVHSKLLLGLKIPAEGELSCAQLEGMSSNAYRCGQVFGIHIRVGGVTFYHQGSANLIDDELRCGEVDVFLAGIAGRGFTPNYWPRILRRLDPKLIVPHHYDNFFLPLDQPMGFSFNVNFGGFVEEIGRVSRDFEIRSLDLLQTVGG